MENQRLGRGPAVRLLKGVGINIVKYIDPILGFDVVRFDEDIGTPDGVSLKDFLTQEYGQEVSDAVKSLLSRSAGGI